MVQPFKKFKLIDLFCGCGGLTSGFMQTGAFDIVYANDNDAAALKTYRLNFDLDGIHAECRDIIDLVENSPELIPSADVIIGGPPCQGFSLLNKNRLGDKRRELWVYYLRVAELADAKFIVMENVPQLLSSDEFILIKKSLKKLGFKYIIAHILNSANYGVPEIRRRTIILASKNMPLMLPCPTHLDPEKLENIKNCYPFSKPRKWNNVQSAMGDLPVPQGTQIRNVPAPLNLHFGRNPTPLSLERYKAVPPGGNRFDLYRNRPDITPSCWIKKKNGGTDLFGRLWWDRPSVTIRTEFFKPEKGRYLHPNQHRPITHREAARIQTFDDNFKFYGSKTEIARQIGNAVPPVMAKAIAEELVLAMSGKYSFTRVEDLYNIYKNWLNEKLKEFEIGEKTCK
ncbi:MAG: DNA cytosine methyltransferase [Victivallales bacterium]|jgi:DNA (cytosine-5)-methyltransferase 1